MRAIVRLGAIWLAVVAGGIALTFGITALFESREPYVDLVVSDASASREVGPRLRFSVASMVSVDATLAMYQKLAERIGRDVGRSGEIVVLPSYADVRRGIELGEVDAALVCTGVFAHAFGRGRMELLVQPEFKGGLEYRSLLIVPAASAAKEWEDLCGATMALTDPESNTGCLVPTAFLIERGHDPWAFFGKVILTGSHDRSIRAVAQATVDAAAVDALVFESVLRQDPSLGGRLRVLWRSEPFGPPPIVVPKGLNADLKNGLRRAFLSLNEDAQGRAILADVGIRRFVVAREEDYRTVIRMYQRVQSRGGIPWR